MSSSHPRLRASDADRDEVIDVLDTALQRGRLSDAEHQTRRDAAREAVYVDDLPALIHDLPEGTALRNDLDVRSGKEIALYEPPTGSAVAPVPGSGAVSNNIAILSGSDVIVAPGTPVVRTYCFMGGDDLDLTDALGPGVELTVESYSLWGGNDIFVPQGVRVIDQTTNLLAGNDIDYDARGDGSGGTVILKGVSVMAGHDVHLSKRAPRNEQPGPSLR